jgi:hypothetical protein
MPETVARLVALHRPDLRLEPEAFYAGGKSVRFFVASPDAAQLLDGGRHDLVVLQDSSWGPLEQPQDFTTCMSRMIERVLASGARPLLYAYSGPKRHRPDDRRRIQAAYDTMGARFDVPVVPCAEALALAQEAEPGLDFHDPDDHHLGIAGGTLYACCWYRTLCGMDAPALTDVAVLDGRIALPPDLAGRLAALADRVCAGRRTGILDAT